MAVFACRDCAELHTVGHKYSSYTGYGTCACMCPLCGNEGKTLCGTCGGTGKTGLFARVCKECHGERTVVCAICRGFLAHPSCHICRGTSCETCFGTRTVDLESILARLKPLPRRRILFQPVDPLRPRGRGGFPLFTYERAWKLLEMNVDLDTSLSVSRDSGWESVHLTGRLIGQERPGYWIYRIAANEYFIEERVGAHDWVEQASAAGAAV